MKRLVSLELDLGLLTLTGLTDRVVFVPIKFKGWRKSFVLETSKIRRNPELSST
jgi:hypothetical protein